MSAVTERRADNRAGGVRGLLQPRRETFESVFGVVYRSLMVGVGVGIGALPLAAAIVLVAEPLVSWPFLLLCSLPLGPAFAAGCWSFQRSRDAADAGPLREVGIGLLRTWRPALAVWSLVCALTFVVVIDIVAVWGTPFAMLLGPLLVVVLLLAVVAAFGVFAGLAAAPGLRFRAQLLGGLVRTVRRPGTSLLSLVLLAAWALIVLAQPVLGLLALGGFVLYAVWSNAAAALAD